MPDSRHAVAERLRDRDVVTAEGSLEVLTENEAADM
jgi:hypothetical protein